VAHLPALRPRLSGLCVVALLAAVPAIGPPWEGRGYAQSDSKPMPEGAGRGDLDGDGIEDCWRLEYGGGSGYGWQELEVRPSCGRRAAVIRIGGSFGDFISIAALPRSLPVPLVHALVERWLGAGTRRSLSAVDGSLAWLIESYKDAGTSADARRGNEVHRRYTPQWQPGTPALPPTQATILQTSDEQRLGRKLGRALTVDGEPQVGGPALVVYHAQNHGALREASRTGGLTLYLTNHALAVRDDVRGVWSWAYVGTGQWKLRFPTTKSAITDGNLVALERWEQQEGNAQANRQLVVIDPRAGRYLVHPLRAGERWSLDAFARRLAAPADGPNEGRGSNPRRETSRGPR
jgi:hypothetical protein